MGSKVDGLGFRGYSGQLIENFQRLFCELLPRCPKAVGILGLMMLASLSFEICFVGFGVGS